MPPKCPYCNETLDYDEQMYNGYNNNYYYNTWRGFCPKCDRTFQWDEVYNFSYCDNLEEVKELE